MAQKPPVSRSPSSKPPVPRYHLYGEDGPAEDFDFFHVETIPARSRSLGWSLEPHSHAHLFQILLILAGSGRLAADGEEATIAPATAVYVPAGSIHGWTFEPGTEGYVVSFTGDYLTGGGEDLTQAERAALTCPGTRVVKLDATGARRLSFALQEMAVERDRAGARRAIFRTLLGLSLVLLFDPAERSVQAEPGREFSLVQFKALVEDHFLTERGAEFYADALGLSVARLNRFCRLFLDRTAAQAVRDRVMLEAKRLLTFSGRSVQEVAFDLGYDDPAYFSRIFRKETGRAPQDFRAAPETDR
ncbi:helix-turn-helix domain-containing protein [Roseibium aestuarii]|uniref:Helix-turn-helix domain-containing protein n=1 Tax=Roseibium aestuarii TaxID=2600299 RepID=A0ABW4JTE3_9HYPH|nr:helix-turn-helix domain-containing protein [Roseibium aestuarii]